MKLNPDCMRAVLLEMEKLPLGGSMRIEALTPVLGSFSPDDVVYTCIKLKEAGYIDALIKQDRFGFSIFDLIDITFYGHQFIADIRDDNVWSKVKETATKIGSFSVDAITTIASKTIAEIIRNQF